MICVFLVIS